MKNFKFIINALILFCLVNTPAFCPKGDFGAIFSDSFNFTYGTVRTGPTGNVKQVNGQNFDAEDIHRQLCESVATVKKATGPVHNVVVAGLTILVKVGDVFDAFYQPLVDGVATLAFVSGDVPKSYNKEGYKIIGASPDYPPFQLLTNFGVRVKSPSPLVKSHGAILKQYHEGWEKAQKDGVAMLQSTLKEDLAAGMPHDSVYSLLKNMNKHMDEREREANVSFGSSIDSEQYLLAYLNAKKDKVVPTQTNLEFRFKDLLPKYRTEKIRELRRNLAKKLGESDDVNTMRRHLATFDSDLALYEGSTVAGYIFHIHSTNEMCCCCAFSIAEEFLFREWNKRLQRQDEAEPFLFVLASASQMIQGNAGRPGIGQDNRLAEGDYDISDGPSGRRVKLNKDHRAIIQKVIKDNEGLRAREDRKDSKKDDKKSEKKDSKDDPKDTKKDDKKTGSGIAKPGSAIPAATKDKSSNKPAAAPSTAK